MDRKLLSCIYNFEWMIQKKIQENVVLHHVKMKPENGLKFLFLPCIYDLSPIVEYISL